MRQKDVRNVMKIIGSADDSFRMSICDSSRVVSDLIQAFVENCLDSKHNMLPAKLLET